MLEAFLSKILKPSRIAEEDAFRHDQNEIMPRALFPGTKEKNALCRD